MFKSIFQGIQYITRNGGTPGQGIKQEKTKVTILLDGVNQLSKIKRECLYCFYHNIF